MPPSLQLATGKLEAGAMGIFLKKSIAFNYNRALWIVISFWDEIITSEL